VVSRAGLGFEIEFHDERETQRFQKRFSSLVADQQNVASECRPQRIPALSGAGVPSGFRRSRNRQAACCWAHTCRTPFRRNGAKPPITASGVRPKVGICCGGMWAPRAASNRQRSRRNVMIATSPRQLKRGGTSPTSRPRLVYHGGQICLPGGRPIITNLRRCRYAKAGAWSCGNITRRKPDVSALHGTPSARVDTPPPEQCERRSRIVPSAVRRKR
jgi:hypothetical protein